MLWLKTIGFFWAIDEMFNNAENKAQVTEKYYNTKWCWETITSLPGCHHPRTSKILARFGWSTIQKWSCGTTAGCQSDDFQAGHRWNHEVTPVGPDGLWSQNLVSKLGDDQWQRSIHGHTSIHFHLPETKWNCIHLQTSGAIQLHKSRSRWTLSVWHSSVDTRSPGKIRLQPTTLLEATICFQNFHVILYVLLRMEHPLTRAYSYKKFYNMSLCTRGSTECKTTPLNPRFQQFADVNLRIWVVLHRAGTENWVPKNNNGIEMCITYDIKGMCNTNCPLHGDHREHTALEDHMLHERCNIHYCPE